MTIAAWREIMATVALFLGGLVVEFDLVNSWGLEMTKFPQLSSRRRIMITSLSSTTIAGSNTAVSNNNNLNLLPIFEADNCFRRGAELEKIGQARAAHASFHEAATLYQCFLDQQVKFDDDNDATPLLSAEQVNDEQKNHDNDNSDGQAPNHCISADCRSVLAYTCVRLAHLSHDFLGDSKAAARLYKEATKIDSSPSAVAFDGLGIATEASGGSLTEAIKAYTAAYNISPTDKVIAFHLAVALERNGQLEQANNILDQLRRGEEATAASSALVDSWGYVRWHTRRVKDDQLNLHRGTRAMLKLGLDAAMDLILRQENGLVCEFGVGNGRSMRMMQELLPLGVEINGFDTFTGLPTAWGNEPAGAYSTAGIIPKIEGSVIFHQGLFKHTIPQFLKISPQGQPLAFANIDCDLYSSTCDVLEAVHNRIVPGTVLVFDEYLITPSWRQDEFRAWRECCKRFGWRYEYLAFSLTSNQAVIRVIEA